MSRQAYIVGGGIAALSAAILLIRDKHLAGDQIHILEASRQTGGSLDGGGNPDSGYLVRGGRMFEAHFGCTFDLLQNIPSLINPNISVTEEIKQFTEAVVTSSKCRLVINGNRTDGPLFELAIGDKVKLLRLPYLSEKSLSTSSIEDYFTEAFFDTNFWIMWSTMFAFQRWHSLAECRRYMRRFMHLLPGFNRLQGIHRTELNQYESIVNPCIKWLEQQGVHIHVNTAVSAVSFDDNKSHVVCIDYRNQSGIHTADVHKEDWVLVTLGSMTDASTLGDTTRPPNIRQSSANANSWTLWRQLAQVSPQFGNPDVFASSTKQSQWDSFTVTLPNPKFFDYMERFTGNRAGTGGLVTFKHSNWLLSVVLAHHPHFSSQPADCRVFWGYGLHSWKPGDFVKKPMSACNGQEILDELTYQLGLDAHSKASLFNEAKCIPCHMPYITSQFMPRGPGDRPQVIPAGAKNYAFIGQFCELPEDTVFTVEYSVRSAQSAVTGLTGRNAVTPIYRGIRRPGVVASALWTLLTNGRG